MEAYAIYTYNAASDTELSFNEGSTVKVLSDKDPEWYFAELGGQEGYAPLTYIKFNKPLWYRDVTKLEATHLLNEKKGKANRHARGAFLVRPSESGQGAISLSVRIDDVEHFKIVRENGEYFVWRAAPHFSSVDQLVSHYKHKSISKTENVVLRDMNLSRVTVSYDYKAQTDEEIDIYTGETITLFDNTDQNWWKGHLERDGAVFRGLFPATYVVAM